MQFYTRYIEQRCTALERFEAFLFLGCYQSWKGVGRQIEIENDITISFIDL